MLGLLGCFSDESIHDQLLQSVAANCVESMALQTAAATKLPGNLQTAVANVNIACAGHPESGDSAIVLPLVIEPTWLDSVYNGW